MKDPDIELSKWKQELNREGLDSLSVLRHLLLWE